MAAFSESFINTALHRLPWADKALGGPHSSLPFPTHRGGDTDMGVWGESPLWALMLGLLEGK